MQLAYTYFPAEEGGYIGFPDNYPDWWTEGETIEELEMMLESSYNDFNDLYTTLDTKAEFRPDVLYHGLLTFSVREAVLA